MRRSARAAGAAGLVAVVAAGAFLALKAGAPESVTSPDVGDLAALYYPLMRYAFGELAAARLPLWDPYQSCGEPLLANPSIGFWYPLYAPFLVLDASAALRLDVLLHLAIAALAMWALCRDVGLRWWPAVIGGLVYAYHGGMLIKTNYPSFLAAVAWIPLIVLFARRVVEHGRRRDGAWLALVVALALLGGYLQFVYFTLWALLPVLAVQAWGRVRCHEAASLWRPAGLLLLAGTVAVAIALVRLLPGAEFMQETWRPPGSLDLAAAAANAVPPRQFLAFALTPLRAANRYTQSMSESYVGIVPFGLALAGLLTWRRRGLALAIAAVGAAAVLYAFGTHAFLFPIVFGLPGGSWFRAPDRALVIYGFSISMLCAAGLDPLFAERDAASPTRARRLVVPAAVGLAALAAAAIGPRAGVGAALAVAAVGAALLVALAAARGHRRVSGAAAALLALLIFGDLVHAQRHLRLLPADADAFFARNDDFFDLIRARQGFDRTYLWATSQPSSPLYFFTDIAAAGLVHGVYSATSYAGGVSGRRLEDYLGLLGPRAVIPLGHVAFKLTAANVQASRLMGVRFLLLEDGQQAAVMSPEILAGLRELRRARGIVLYEDPQVFPRAFLAPRVEVVRDPATLLARLPDTDLRGVALLEAGLDEPLPAAPAGAAGTATITRYRPDAVDVETAAPDASLLVLTDQYRAGWQATLDGAPAAIHRADYLFRGVRVPAGAHRIEFRYRPRPLLVGAAGSVAGLAVLALLLRRRGGGLPAA